MWRSTFNFSAQLKSLHFFLTFSDKSRLLDFSYTLLHAYLVGLTRSLINSSMTESPSDGAAMHMYLKQMMHNVSLIQSYRAYHPGVQPKKWESYSFKEQQMASYASVFMSGFIRTRQGERGKIVPKVRSVDTQRDETVGQAEAATQSQTETGSRWAAAVAHRAGTGRLADRGLTGQGTHLDTCLRDIFDWVIIRRCWRRGVDAAQQLILGKVCSFSHRLEPVRYETLWAVRGIMSKENWFKHCLLVFRIRWLCQTL